MAEREAGRDAGTDLREQNTLTGRIIRILDYLFGCRHDFSFPHPGRPEDDECPELDYQTCLGCGDRRISSIQLRENPRWQTVETPWSAKVVELPVRKVGS